MAKAKKTTKKSTGPEVQPESPQLEGVDPLTEGKTLYSSEDVKGSAVETEVSDTTSSQALPASEVPNSDAEKQDEVAEGREE